MLGAELCDELLRYVASEVPVDLPDVHLHAVLAAGCEAFGNLVALGYYIRRGRKYLAGVIGDAAPEHVREYRGEPVVLKVENRVIPGAVLHAVGAMAPDSAELAGFSGMRDAVGLLE
jgi:hypothetical protein